MTFVLEVKSSKEALDWCLHNCPRHEQTCAANCDLRKKWKIPPHGKRYPT